MVTSIHSIQKSTRNSQKLGNKLANEQNARRSNAVFSRKKTRKNKMNSSNPSYQSMDCVIKWVIRLINSIRIFFIFFSIFFKLFIWPSDVKRPKSFRSFTPWTSTNSPLWIRCGAYSILRILVQKTDISRAVWINPRCPNYLVCLWRYWSVMLCRCMICLMI